MFFPYCAKLIGYFASALNIVSSNLWVGPSTTIINIFSLIINMYRWAHINSKSNNIFSSVNKKSEQESNPMP